MNTQDLTGPSVTIEHDLHHRNGTVYLLTLHVAEPREGCGLPCSPVLAVTWEDADEHDSSRPLPVHGCPNLMGLNYSVACRVLRTLGVLA